MDVLVREVRKHREVLRAERIRLGEEQERLLALRRDLALNERVIDAIIEPLRRFVRTGRREQPS